MFAPALKRGAGGNREKATVYNTSTNTNTNTNTICGTKKAAPAELLTANPSPERERRQETLRGAAIALCPRSWAVRASQHLQLCVESTGCVRVSQGVMLQPIYRHPARIEGVVVNGGIECIRTIYRDHRHRLPVALAPPGDRRGIPCAMHRNRTACTVIPATAAIARRLCFSTRYLRRSSSIGIA